MKYTTFTQEDQTQLLVPPDGFERLTIFVFVLCSDFGSVVIFIQVIRLTSESIILLGHKLTNGTDVSGSQLLMQYYVNRLCKYFIRSHNSN